MIHPSSLSMALTRSTLQSSVFGITSLRRLSSKIGLGGHKFGRMQPTQYTMVIQTALDQGVQVFECPSTNEGDAEAILAKAIQDKPVQILKRLGYRTIQESAVSKEQRSGDLLLEVQQQQQQQQQHTTTTTTETKEESRRVIHNLSASYMHDCIESSALLRSNQNIQLIPMVHNPEVHGADTLDRLTEAFCGLEEVVRSEHYPNVHSFGLVSNGLALPKDHPMHLDYRLVFQAADRACQEVGKTTITTASSSSSSLSILQLPANLLEVQGITVARNIKRDRPHVHVYAMRPLTYYANDGTTAAPQAMLDYLLPQGPNQQEWTHRMKGPPTSYHQVLNMAMAHFDGEALLEAQQERSLTEEELETLEGAKVLQSMLQELDANLDHVVSLASHEDRMVQDIIPTLFGTFEALDEPSVHLLSNFFAAHGWTVRYNLATKMRRMLQHGGSDISGSGFFPPHDIPPHVKLQDYALEYLLKEDVIDTVIVGATIPEHVVDAVGVWNHICHPSS